MLRHDNVARHLEVVKRSRRFENSLEHALGFSRLQIGLPLVATERDEVMLSERLVPVKPGWHSPSLHNFPGAPSQTVLSFEVGVEEARTGPFHPTSIDETN